MTTTMEDHQQQRHQNHQNKNQRNKRTISPSASSNSNKTLSFVSDSTMTSTMISDHPKQQQQHKIKNYNSENNDNDAVVNHQAIMELSKKIKKGFIPYFEFKTRPFKQPEEEDDNYDHDGHLDRIPHKNLSFVDVSTNTSSIGQKDKSTDIDISISQTSDKESNYSLHYVDKFVSTVDDFEMKDTSSITDTIPLNNEINLAKEMSNKNQSVQTNSSNPFHSASSIDDHVKSHTSIAVNTEPQNSVKTSNIGIITDPVYIQDSNQQNFSDSSSVSKHGISNKHDTNQTIKSAEPATEEKERINSSDNSVDDSIMNAPIDNDDNDEINKQPSILQPTLEKIQSTTGRLSFCFDSPPRKLSSIMEEKSVLVDEISSFLKQDVDVLSSIRTHNTATSFSFEGADVDASKNTLDWKVTNRLLLEEMEDEEN